MNKRSYNKLYLNKNREEGSEKILLGYKYNARELLLKRDSETYFHVPFTAQPLALRESSLIADGATAGPFPAAADRILKNKKNYGNVTPYGTPTDLATGVWFCSWLYKLPNGKSVWYDRYYNPGSFTYAGAIQDLSKENVYVKHDPIFVDVPSTMILDPGVLYRYFHVGEKTAAALVETFGGTADRKKLHLSSWDTANVDISNSNLPVFISSDVSVVGSTTDPAMNQRAVLDLQNSSQAVVTVPFDVAYNNSDSFTLSFWAYSSNWRSAQSTQLVGNCSTKGGYGVFVESLSAYQHFILPETTYGHLLFINENGSTFLDKPLNTSNVLNVSPRHACVDVDSNVVVLVEDPQATGISSLYKITHAGEILHNNKNFLNIDTQEKTIQLITGPDETYTLITTFGHYVFDSQLKLLTARIEPTDYNSAAAYKYNTKKDSHQLIVKSGVHDVKFIEEDEWSISVADGNLYKNGNLVSTLRKDATALAIDPYENIWVVDSFGVTVHDNETGEIIKTADFAAGNINKHKALGFICVYDAKTKQREWRAILNYSEDRFITTIDLDLNVVKKTDKFSLFNPAVISNLKQDSKKFGFVSKGDFTSYEYKRVFYKLSPFNGKAQLALKANLKDKQQQGQTFKLFKRYAPITWANDGAIHILLTLDSQRLELRVNTVPVATLSYTGRYDLSYELQPPLYIGMSNGSKFSLNEELRYSHALFNGWIGEVRIYDYAIAEKNHQLFLREAYKSTDLYWSVECTPVQYVEKIERMFQNKLPGSKSQFFNLKISGAAITDASIRKILESEIKQIVKSISPAHAELFQIEWID